MHMVYIFFLLGYFRHVSTICRLVIAHFAASRQQDKQDDMDVWGSQRTDVAASQVDEEEDYEVAESGKDALIVLIDARAAMFAPYAPSAAENADKAPATWFHAVVELVVKLLKAKVIASDNSLLSVAFFGSVRLCSYHGSRWCYGGNSCSRVTTSPPLLLMRSCAAQAR